MYAVYTIHTWPGDKFDWAASKNGEARYNESSRDTSLSKTVFEARSVTIGCLLL